MTDALLFNEYNLLKLQEQSYVFLYIYNILDCDEICKSDI